MSFITDGLTMVDQQLYKQKILIDQEKPNDPNYYHNDRYFVLGNDNERYLYVECFKYVDGVRTLANRYIHHVSKHHAVYHSLDSYLS